MKKRIIRTLAVFLCIALSFSGTLSIAADIDPANTEIKQQYPAAFVKALEEMKMEQLLKDEDRVVPGKLVVKFTNNNVSVHTIQYKGWGKDRSICRES